MTALPAAARATAVSQVEPSLGAMAGELLDQVEQLAEPGEEVRDLQWTAPHRVASRAPLRPALVLLVLTDRRLIVARADQTAGVAPTAWPVEYGQLPVVPGTRWSSTGMAMDGRSMVTFRRRVPPTRAYLATPPPTAAWIQQAEVRADAPPAGWNADPTGRHELRYWDGRVWTPDVSDGGVQARDPLG